MFSLFASNSNASKRKLVETLGPEQPLKMNKGISPEIRPIYSRDVQDALVKGSLDAASDFLLSLQDTQLIVDRFPDLLVPDLSTMPNHTRVSLQQIWHDAGHEQFPHSNGPLCFIDKDSQDQLG